VGRRRRVRDKELEYLRRRVRELELDRYVGEVEASYFNLRVEGSRLAKKLGVV
jgi:hypothetical protein